MFNGILFFVRAINVGSICHEQRCSTRFCRYTSIWKLQIKLLGAEKRNKYCWFCYFIKEGLYDIEFSIKILYRYHDVYVLLMYWTIAIYKHKPLKNVFISLYRLPIWKSIFLSICKQQNTCLALIAIWINLYISYFRLTIKQDH